MHFEKKKNMEKPVLDLTCELKLLLEKIYGKSNNSLVIGKINNRNNTLYYYDEEIYRRMVDMVDVLNSGYLSIGIQRFNEITQEINNNNKDKSLCPQCACLSTLEDGKWIVEFKKIKKIKYHRTYGKKITATLILNKEPIVKLSSEEKNKIYGYFGRPHYVKERAHKQEAEGISYWINKNMFHNIKFRDFSSKFFELIGNMEKKYILKDIGRSIKNCGFFLPPISYSKISQFHKPSDIFNYFSVEKNNLRLNINKYDINLLYCILKLLNYVDVNSIYKLCNLDLNKLLRLINMGALYDGLNNEESVSYFIKAYFVDCFGDNIKGNNRLISDFVNLSIELNEQISLNLTMKQILKKHDNMAIAERIKNFQQYNNEMLTIENSKFKI